MPILRFTAHLRRVAPPGPLAVTAEDLGGALAAAFALAPRLKGYILDDQGRLRRHIAIFHAGERIAGMVDFSRPVGREDEIFIMQALSGG